MILGPMSYKELEEVTQLPGVNSAYRRSVLDEVGGFDDGAIGALVGQGGSSIRGMEEEFGLKLKVKGAAELPRGTKKIGSSAPEWDMQAERSKGSHSWERSGGPKPRRKGKRRR